MSKYIIDLRPDCKVVQQICASDGNVSVGTRSVGLLDALTDDYVKENFKHLQDTAYQKGFEDGKKEAESSEVIEQAKVDAFNKGMLHKGEKIHDAYQRGLDDAWEAARKLFSSMADSDIEKVFPTEWNNGGFNALINLQPQKAIAKLKAYEEKQKADGEIKVGDEVNLLGDCFIVTRIFQPRNMKEQCDGIDDDGCVYSNVLIDDLEKTGRHFDIASILEDMRND